MVDLKPPIVLFAPLVAVALVSFGLIRGQQGDGGTFLARQQRAQPLTAAAVASGVESAPDPVTHAHGSWAICSALGSDELLNPWRCSISYRSGRRIQYLVQVHADGSYAGDHEFVQFRGRSYRDTGRVTGCCIAVP